MEVLRITSQGKILLCTIKGDMTLEACELFQEQLEEAIADKNPEVLVLDLSTVRLSDSSGICSLIALEAQLRGGGKRLILFRPNEAVRQTLKLVQLDAFFQTIDSKDELLAALPELIDPNNRA